MRAFILSSLFLLSCASFSQNFEGVLTYKIDMPEMMLRSIPPQLVDSVKSTKKFIKNDHIRTETFSPMGKQVMLEKIGSDTTYLLMHLMGKDIAIEILGTDKPESKKDSLVETGKGSKMFGFKTEKASYTKYGSKYEIIYTKQLDVNYGNSFKSLGGVALQFPIIISEFEILIYTCTGIEKKPIADDLFDIPVNYEVLTMEEFGKMIGG